MVLKEATVSGLVLTTLDGTVKTASPTLGLTLKREKPLTDFNHKDERRDRFERKKKSKKFKAAPKFKLTKRKAYKRGAKDEQEDK